LMQDARQGEHENMKTLLNKGDIDLLYEMYGRAKGVKSKEWLLEQKFPNYLRSK
jgi:hypothetical protein